MLPVSTHLLGKNFTLYHLSLDLASRRFHHPVDDAIGFVGRKGPLVVSKMQAQRHVFTGGCVFFVFINNDWLNARL